MKTWLLPLAGIVILPIPTTLTLNHQNVAQETTLITTLNNNNLKINNKNSGYDWNNMQNSINDKLNNSIIKTKLTAAQITDLKTKTNNITNQFNNNNTCRCNWYCCSYYIT